MSQRLVLSPAASNALVALSRALLAATRTASLYPPEHPVAQASVGRVQQALAAAAERQVSAAISITPSELLIGGAVVAAETSAADVNATAHLARLLHSCGILEIGFDAVVPAPALARLLAFLARLSARALEGDPDIAQAWAGQGHPSVRIVAVDYRALLADGDRATPSSERDDLWRTLVSALRSGRRTFDAREQERLLEIGGDPEALAALADTLTAEQCTPDGSPLVTTQAATVLSCFRQLAAVAAVIAPGRAREILGNLASALSRLDPHVSLQVLALDRRTAAPGEQGLTAALDEETVARLVAAVVALEGAASPRLSHVFELLVPDHDSRRRVLQHARSFAAGEAAARSGSAAVFDSFWDSVEALLLSYDDQPYVSEDYRVVLDANRCAETGPSAAGLPEMTEWLETLGEQCLQGLSIALLSDLLRLEQATDRAVVVLNHLAALAEDLLLAGAFDEALSVIEAIGAARGRDDLATAAAQVLERLGGSPALAETSTMVEELSDDDWTRLERCCLALGPSTLTSLARAVGEEEATLASERAGHLVVAMADESLPFLNAVLAHAHIGARIRVAALLGQIARPAAIPLLQTLLRSPEAAVLQAAVRSLAGIEDPAAARALHVALGATEGEKRQAVVNALVAARDRRVVPLLVRVLNDCQPLAEDFQVALHTLDALARLADPRAVAAITRVMMLRSWLSRRRLRALKRACVLALSRIADASATGALDEAGRSGDRMLRGLLRARATAPAGAA